MGTGRRDFLKTGAVATVAFGVGSAFTCSKASIEVEVSTAITFLNKVKGLLPSREQAIVKIVGALNDFNSFYQRGDFTSAGKFFNTVDADFTQLINDIGVNLSPSVKIALALIDAAISAIAVLLQHSVPPAVATKAKSTMSPEQAAAANAVERRAAHAEKLFTAIH